MLSLVNVRSAQIQLIANGDFEAGDFTGWTQSGDTSFDGVGLTHHSGNYGAFFGAFGAFSGISQSLSVVPGQTYTIDFYVKNGGGTPSAISVNWGTLNLLNTLPTVGDWTHYNYSEVASGATTMDLEFRNDDGFLYLDDVSVTAQTASVPEPSAMIDVAFLLVPPLGVSAIRRIRKTRVAAV